MNRLNEFGDKQYKTFLPTAIAVILPDDDNSRMAQNVC
jgi:hypothetical protein